jgi:hypothetical protein
MFNGRGLLEAIGVDDAIQKSIYYIPIWKFHIIPQCADSVVAITVACQAMNSGSNPDRRTNLLFRHPLTAFHLSQRKPYRTLK